MRRPHWILLLLCACLVLVLVVARQQRLGPKQIELVRAGYVGPGQDWEAVLRLAKYEGEEEPAWQVHSENGEELKARIVRGERGTCVVRVHPGFVRPVEVHVTASVGGRRVATLRLARLEPHEEHFDVQDVPHIAAETEDGELVVRGYPVWPSGVLPSITLLRTNRARFDSRRSLAKWVKVGGWEWRTTLAYAKHVSAVELEIAEDGPIRHRFELRGLAMEIVEGAPVVVNPRPQAAVSLRGLRLVLPEQRTASSEAGTASLRIESEVPLTLQSSPVIVSPAPAEVGLDRWTVLLSPEPVRASAGATTGSGVMGTTTPVAPAAGPLPPLTLELLMPPKADAPPPLRISLYVAKG